MSDIKEFETPHYCTQAEAINRINLLLVGNGHPEDGLAFKVGRMTEDTAEIKKLVGDLGIKYQQSIDAAVSASHGLEKYKAEMEKYEAGKEAIIAKGNAKFTKVTQFIGAVVVVLSLLIAYVNLKNTMVKKLDTIEMEAKARTQPHDTIYITK